MTDIRSPRPPVQLDMNADGSFRQASAAFAPPGPLSGAILRWALIVAGVATLAGFAFLALWAAIVMIPIAIGAAALAYAVLRYRIWKASGSHFRRR